MDITVYNAFHNVEATIRVSELPCDLSSGQIQRCRAALCGIAGCICGGDLGQRSDEDHSEAWDDGAEPVDIVSTGNGGVRLTY